jgi:serine/threonine-protein kinase RsbT
MSVNESTDFQTERVPTVRMVPGSPARNLRSLPSVVRIRIKKLDDIVAARRRGREIAAQLGFSNCDLTLIATAISEIARNAVEYASGGDIVLTSIKEGNKRGLKIVVSDEGPGIADVPTVMRDGYSSGAGLGIGLPGARRLVDDFEINSEIGKGTVVTMKKWVA